VIRQGPLLQTDKHGAIWGTEAGEVLPGQILHAAAEPVTEDGHTTVLLQTGGAVDIGLLQVAEHLSGDAAGEHEHLDEHFPPPGGVEHAGTEGEPEGQPAHWFESEPDMPNEPPSPQEMAEAAYRSRHGHEGPGPADPSEWEAEHGHPAEQAEDGAMHGFREGEGAEEAPHQMPGGRHGHDGSEDGEGHGMAKHPASPQDPELDALAQQEMQEHGLNDPFPEHPEHAGQDPELDPQNSAGHGDGGHPEPGLPDSPQEGAAPGGGGHDGDHMADPAIGFEGGDQ
ncbi:unnamed protein product, partial [Symbiodinium pilosum]